MFFGAVIVALVIYILRARNAVGVGGVVTVQDPDSAVQLIPNLTQQIIQRTEGTYDPIGSAMSSASYTGAI